MKRNNYKCLNFRKKISFSKFLFTACCVFNLFFILIFEKYCKKITACSKEIERKELKSHAEEEQATSTIWLPFAANIDRLLRIFDNENKSSTFRICPCCGSYTEGLFLSYNGHSDRQCSVCKALERHRRACAVLGSGKLRHNGLPFFQANNPKDRAAGLPFRLLHFGPFQHMATEINKASSIATNFNIDQISVDFLQKGSGQGNPTVFFGDVTDLAFPDEFSDGVAIFHVLEHVADLTKAISELARVLRKETGWALIEVPCSLSLPETVDCRSAQSNEERRKCAGQIDHMWKFNCHDFHTCLEYSLLSCYHLDGSDPKDYGNFAPLVPKMKLKNEENDQLFVCTV